MRTILIATLLCGGAFPQIPKPNDAPLPRSPQESAAGAALPSGFRLELVEAEPRLFEPSGLCWDERGRLFVCGLHGYNLEGQLEVDELNKAGVLDKQVRRIDANPDAIKAARGKQHGSVRMFTDDDGDGKYERVTVIDDKLPPCYGIVPARGGIIVACAPDIVHLAVDDAGVIKRETLFTGFTAEILERRINNPQWGTDGWIYVGRGGAGSTVSGPHLKAPVRLPNTDFRIRADGSAIEPVTGATRTVGFAFDGFGDRYVVSTNTPCMLVPPLEWRYLARNPFAATSLPDINLNTDQRCYPVSQPHPWRLKRAEDPGFNRYYTQRYGAKESAPNGFFTSLCSPLVYLDAALPGLAGQLFCCEPAQNLITRGELGWKDGMPSYRRIDDKKEFLASNDIWFHPISLAVGPDGSIYIADFYREIIEDYSAVPRYLQQQYGLTNGKDHGRLWRIAHEKQLKAPSADMSRLSAADLARETASPHQWRRDTARRLLLERRDPAAADVLKSLEPQDPVAFLSVLVAQDLLNTLTADRAARLLKHPLPRMRIQGLKLCERWLNEPALRKQCLALADDPDAGVVIQLALSLGECRDPEALAALQRMARERGSKQWMGPAVLSSLSGRCGEMLAALLAEPPRSGEAAALLGPLASAVAARGDATELSAVLVSVSKTNDSECKRAVLFGLKTSIKNAMPLPLTAEAREAVAKLMEDRNPEIVQSGRMLRINFRLESDADRSARLKSAVETLRNVQAADKARIAAAAELDFERDPALTELLLDAVAGATPKLRDALLAAVLARRDSHPAVVAAMEAKRLLPSLLTPPQRLLLTESPDAALKTRAQRIFADWNRVDDETFRKYSAALERPRDAARGGALFRTHCAQCHQAHGTGIAVGPNLSSEFQRAEATILRDILTPSAVLSPGFTVYSVELQDGRVAGGVLAGESPGSITLRAAEGKETVILRRDIAGLKATATSLMPDDLMKTMTPKDVADLLSWIRNPPDFLVLLDENPGILKSFRDGKAAFVAADAHRGKLSLAVEPKQISSAKVPEWNFRIRENPGIGEYRYLRFAWKSPAGTGVLIELAASGKWPPAQSPQRRYFSGANSTGWKAVAVADAPPREWTVVTVDLWKDFGDFTLTGIAPTAMGGTAYFDSIDLHRTNPESVPEKK